MGRGVWAARRAPFADRRRRSMTNPLRQPSRIFGSLERKCGLRDVTVFARAMCGFKTVTTWLCRARYPLLAPELSSATRRMLVRVRIDDDLDACERFVSCRARPRRLYAPVATQSAWLHRAALPTVPMGGGSRRRDRWSRRSPRRRPAGDHGARASHDGADRDQLVSSHGFSCHLSLAGGVSAAGCC